MEELLTRDEFREAVLRRDDRRCVWCKKSDGPMDAHHIMERRLWGDGGYYSNNGATLCAGFPDGCHMRAETTRLSCAEIRNAAGIKRILLPPHLYEDQEYDKWGNIIMPDGTRIKGELFWDESVKKALAEGKMLERFRARVKYPRTHHLPWSPGVVDDDRVVESLRWFEGERVVVTEKMDGENTTMYSDAMHARSLDSGSHPSRDWVRNFHGKLMGHVPAGWRLCGENLYARHSLAYDDLPSYFLLFSIWDDRNVCLSWDATEEYAAVLGIEMVPTIYDGPWNEALVEELGDRMDLTSREGYVVRVAREFSFVEFRHVVAKFVRAAHVGTSHNWMMKQVVRNRLRSEVRE